MNTTDNEELMLKLAHSDLFESKHELGYVNKELATTNKRFAETNRRFAQVVEQLSGANLQGLTRSLH